MSLHSGSMARCLPMLFTKFSITKRPCRFFPGRGVVTRYHPALYSKPVTLACAFPTWFRKRTPGRGHTAPALLLFTAQQLSAMRHRKAPVHHYEGMYHFKYEISITTSFFSVNTKISSIHEKTVIIALFFFPDTEILTFPRECAMIEIICKIRLRTGMTRSPFF